MTMVEPVDAAWYLYRDRLTIRTARCHCGRTAPSITFLALMERRRDLEDTAPDYFEYRGPFLRQEAGCVRCGMWPGDDLTASFGGHPNDRCDTYELDTRDEPFDLYYCGHDGWTVESDDAPAPIEEN